MGIRKGSTLLLGVCVAALATVCLTGCGASSEEVAARQKAEQQSMIEELEWRGFTDVSYQTSDWTNPGYSYTFYANANGCRVVLTRYSEPAAIGKEWLLSERSPNSADDIQMYNPSALKVGALDAFQYCYSVSAPSPAG